MSGPADGVYSFSGTVHKDVPATSDEALKPFKVEGSVTCDNYNDGIAGCKYASAAEISMATELSLDQPQDNGLRGCQYNKTGTSSFARLEYFPTAGFDEYVNNEAQRYGHRVVDVPELGDKAKKVNAIYVRTTAERSWGVRSKLPGPSMREKRTPSDRLMRRSPLPSSSSLASRPIPIEVPKRFIPVTRRQASGCGLCRHNILANTEIRHL